MAPKVIKKLKRRFSKKKKNKDQVSLKTLASAENAQPVNDANQQEVDRTDNYTKDGASDVLEAGASGYETGSPDEPHVHPLSMGREGYGTKNEDVQHTDRTVCVTLTSNMETGDMNGEGKDTKEDLNFGDTTSSGDNSTATTSHGTAVIEGSEVEGKETRDDNQGIGVGDTTSSGYGSAAVSSETSPAMSATSSVNGLLIPDTAKGVSGQDRHRMDSEGFVPTLERHQIAHLSASSRDNFDVNELNSKLQEKQTDNITQSFQPLVESPTPEHEACDVELNGKTYSFKVSHALADSSSEGDSDDGDDNLDDNYDHPIPEDLALKIASLCEESDVRYIYITQSRQRHTDKVLLTIYGDGSEKVETELQAYVLNKHTNFDIETVDTEGYYYHNEFVGENSGDLQIIKYVLENNRWIPRKKASCDLIIRGTANNTANKATCYYAVVSAHLVLETSGCEAMLKNDSTKKMADILDKLQPGIYRYTLRMHSRNIELDLTEAPMFTYAHHFSNEDHFKEKEAKERRNSGKKRQWIPHKRFMKDAAILKLSQVAELKSLEKNLIAASKRVLYSGHKPTEYEVAEVLSIHDPVQLLELHRRKIDIKVGGLDGRLHFVGESDWRKSISTAGPKLSMQAHRIEFTTKYHALFPGNSGQVVYAVHATKKILYPLGILSGEPKEYIKKPKCGTSIYFAALLAPNLECIEETFQPFVSDLQSLSHNSDHNHSIKSVLENLSAMMPARKKKVQSSTRPPIQMMSKLEDQPALPSTPRTENKIQNRIDDVCNNNNSLPDSGLFSAQQSLSDSN